MLAAGSWANGKLFALPGDKPALDKQPKEPKKAEEANPGPKFTAKSRDGKATDKEPQAEAPAEGFTLSPLLALSLPKPGCVRVAVQCCMHPGGPGRPADLPPTACDVHRKYTAASTPLTQDTRVPHTLPPRHVTVKAG